MTRHGLFSPPCPSRCQPAQWEHSTGRRSPVPSGIPAKRKPAGRLHCQVYPTTLAGAPEGRGMLPAPVLGAGCRVPGRQVAQAHARQLLPGGTQRDSQSTYLARCSSWSAGTLPHPLWGAFPTPAHCTPAGKHRAVCSVAAFTGGKR
jgi:hypothetical protein